MKKKYQYLFFVSILLLLIPTQIFALSPTITQNEADGTVYKVEATFSNTYTNGTLFELSVELTAVNFGTLTGVIEAFYDIEIDVTFSGDTYFLSDNTTLADITTEGDSSSATLTNNLTGILDDNFVIALAIQFKGSNSQGEDPNYGFLWVPGMVRVKEASIGIILPILAVISLAYFGRKRMKK